MKPAEHGGGHRSGARAPRIAAATLSGLTLAACNLAPQYAPPRLVIAPAYKEAVPWTQAQPGETLARGAWWTAFHDPVLNGLEDQVDTANPTLAAALAAYDQARALGAEANGASLPTVTASGSPTYNRQSDNRPLRGAGQPNEYAADTVGVGVTYELDLWGRVRDLVAAGRAEAQATAADLANIRLSLQIELADDYLSLRGLDAQARLLANTTEAYQKALDLTQARHTGGVASGLDVSRAEAQLSSAKAQNSQVAAQRALFEHAIASLVGKSASALTIAPAINDRLIPDVPAGVPSTLIQRRPDIAAAERRAYAANRQIGVARAAFFPTVNLDPQYGFQNAGGQNLLIAPNTFWTVGPEIALTLFDGGARRAAAAASRAAFQLASAQYRAAVLSAFQQVEDQLALVNHYRAEAADQADAVMASRTTTRLSLVRYREGATNYLDVVTAQTSELLAEQTALALETDRQRASVDLVRALGGGWSTTDLPALAHASDIDQIVLAPTPGAVAAR
jgi:NodT family efflux transporter outer membrane factor (OMF) lipoprotein